jgi:hypothetical protein
VLAPVDVHAIDDALHAVRAPAAEVMAAGSDARARIGHRAERIDLRRSARVHEAAPARRERLTNQLTQ